MSVASKKIIQIIPAEGWLALYNDGQGGQFADRIAMWALVQDEDGKTDVEGLSATDYVDRCEEMVNFDCYIHESRYQQPGKPS